MPSSWLTSSGRPDSSLTTSAALSADASAAPVPAMRRTFSPLPLSKSSAVGASTVQRAIPVLRGETYFLNYRPRYIVLPESQDVSRFCLGAAQPQAAPRPGDTAQPGGWNHAPVRDDLLVLILRRRSPRHCRRRAAPATTRAGSPPSRT